MGAQWIHGEENNPIYKLAAENHLLADSNLPALNSFEEFWETRFYTQEGRELDSDVVKETLTVLDQIFDEADKFHRENKPLLNKDESMGTFAFDMFHKYLQTTKCHDDDRGTSRVKEALFNWRMQMEKIECGCRSLYEMSAHAWGEFRECQGQDEVTLRRGFRSVFDLLLQGVPESSVRTSTPVQCIYWNQEQESKSGVAQNVFSTDTKYNGYPLTVRTKSGEFIPADHVIVTCSLGVLKKNAHFMFKPILPRDKMAAIHRLGFGTVDKIFLEWSEPWWDSETHVIQLAWMPDEPFFVDDDGQDNFTNSGMVRISKSLIIIFIFI